MLQSRTVAEMLRNNYSVALWLIFICQYGCLSDAEPTLGTSSREMGTLGPFHVTEPPDSIGSGALANDPDSLAAMERSENGPPEDITLSAKLVQAHWPILPENLDADIQSQLNSIVNVTLGNALAVPYGTCCHDMRSAETSLWFVMVIVIHSMKLFRTTLLRRRKLLVGWDDCRACYR